MKNIIKIVILLLILITTEVKAVNNEGYLRRDEKIEGVYYYKHRNDTDTIKYEYHNFHEQAYMYRTSLTNNIVYCVESWEPLGNNSSNDYVEANYMDANLTKEQDLYIRLLQFYGYGYVDNKVNHLDHKWYAVTQYLIWEYLSPHIEHYFVSSLTSTTPIYPFEAEINELRNMVLKEAFVPLENTLPLTLFKNKSLTINYKENLLDPFKITKEDKIDLILTPTSMTIKPKTEGATYINIEKEHKYYNVPTKYIVSNNYQNGLIRGDMPSTKARYFFQILSGKLKVIVKYKNLKNNEYELFKDIKVYIKNKETNEVIESTTNELGEVNISNLDEGNYIIDVEEKDNYLKPEVEEIRIDENNKSKEVELKYDKQLLNLYIEKELENTYIKNEKIMFDRIKGDNIEFGLYNKDDELINTYKTNQDGIIDELIELDYDIYYIKEIKTKPGYIVDKNKYYIEFIKKDREDINKYSFSLYNELEKYNLEIKVVTLDDYKVIDNSDIVITNEEDEKIHELKTDINGSINITLPKGNYYIKQLTTKEDYFIDEEKHSITLDSNKEKIILNKTYNKELNVEVDKTLSMNYYHEYIVILLIALKIICKKHLYI